MSPGRIVALVIGCLLALSGAGLLVGGGSLGLAVATQRDADGYFEVTLDRITTDARAVTAGDIAFTAEPGTAGWALGTVDADVRLRATVARDAGDVFVGIARSIDVEGYLDDVAHDEVVELEGGRRPQLRRAAGDRAPVAPTEMVIWTESATGSGTVEVVWPAQGGRWNVVVMNADGTPGLATDVEVGLRLGFLVPLAIGFLVSGAIVTAGAVGLIVWAVRSRPRPGSDDRVDEHVAGVDDAPADAGAPDSAPREAPTHDMPAAATPFPFPPPPPPPPPGRPSGAPTDRPAGSTGPGDR